MTWVTVTKSFTVSAGATSTQTIYTVTSGRKFRLKKARFWFPAGSNSELQAVILHGVEKVVPEDGYVAGDGQEFTYDVDIEYGSEEAVKALLTNTSATDSHKIQITLEGEEA